MLLDFSRPGKPTDNACADAFDVRIGSECRNERWFLDPDDARQQAEAWRVEYGRVAP